MISVQEKLNRTEYYPDDERDLFVAVVNDVILQRGYAEIRVGPNFKVVKDLEELTRWIDKHEFKVTLGEYEWGVVYE